MNSKKQKVIDTLDPAKWKCPICGKFRPNTKFSQVISTHQIFCFKCRDNFLKTGLFIHQWVVDLGFKWDYDGLCVKNPK